MNLTTARIISLSIIAKKPGRYEFQNGERA